MSSPDKRYLSVAAVVAVGGWEKQHEEELLAPLAIHGSTRDRVVWGPGEKDSSEVAMSDCGELYPADVSRDRRNGAV